MHSGDAVLLSCLKACQNHADCHELLFNQVSLAGVGQ